MINAIINHKDKTAVIEFPLDLYPLYQSLTDVGFQGGPHRVKLTDNEGDDMRVKLYSESDFGNHLILLFNENDTLYQLYRYNPDYYLLSFDNESYDFGR